MKTTSITGKELITMVLKGTKKPLSLTDIWNEAKKKGYAKLYARGTDAEQKKRQIGSDLYRWYKQDDSPLERFEKGLYGKNITYSFLKNPPIIGIDTRDPIELKGVESNINREATGNIFIVHGRDEGAKESVSNFIHKLKLNPIILHEKPNEGKTIIEKLESYANVDFAIVLLTPDDIGNSKDNPNKAEPRARQNVIFELGYFVGKLGREKVCALYKENVEIPTDYKGVTYLSMDNNTNWRNKLIQEFNNVGINVEKDLIINLF